MTFYKPDKAIEERTQNMKSNNLLKITGLHVSVGDKEILHGVDLTVNSDETHVLMGPNGTGKSTLGYAITGNPAYTVTEGDIVFGGESIVDMPVNERAKKGIFLSFQNPLEVPGVTLSSFIRSALEQKTKTRLRLWDFKKKLAETMKLLDMDESYADRDLNVGFSGGEKKKAEILQMLMLEPKLAILDGTGYPAVAYGKTKLMSLKEFSSIDKEKAENMRKDVRKTLDQLLRLRLGLEEVELEWTCDGTIYKTVCVVSGTLGILYENVFINSFQPGVETTTVRSEF